MQALTGMLEETIQDGAALSTSLSRKATLLMAEVLQMSNRVLPLSMAAKIQVLLPLIFREILQQLMSSQALPRVFNMASDYKQGVHRIVGTSTLSAIDSYNRNRVRLQPMTFQDAARPRYVSR